MADIPLIRNGEKMSEVRINSLNAAITKLNELAKAGGVPGPRGPEGPTGPQGPQGPKGDPLTAQDIYNAENRGEATGTGSLKSLDDGWWYVPTNSQRTGRPKGSRGDLLLYKRQVSADGVALLAYGMDKEGPQMWAEFKTATSSGFTPWVKLSVTDILTIKEVEDALTAKGWGPAPGGTVQPAQRKTVYASFGNAFPSRLSDMQNSYLPTITLTRAETIGERIFVALPIEDGKAVTGIKVGAGLAALWQYRDMNIGGQPFRVFYSTGAYYTTSETVTVEGVA